VNTKLCVTTILLAGAATAGWAQNAPPAGPRGQFQPDRPPPMQQDGQEMLQRGGPGGQPPMRQGASMAPQRGGPGTDDPLAQFFFPPELVMQNQGLLGLSGEQKSTIREAMQKSMSQFSDLQWKQSEAAEAMAALFKPERVDDEKTLAQLDKLLDIENQIKHLHVATMIKIKNTLTPEQQTKLRRLKRSMTPPPVEQMDGPRARPMGPGGMQGQGQWQRPQGPDGGPRDFQGPGPGQPPPPQGDRPPPEEN
jgi:Spy/CpxP family protein refolding chaperone